MQEWPLDLIRLFLDDALGTRAWIEVGGSGACQPYGARLLSVGG
jgi:hypothetical protein